MSKVAHSNKTTKARRRFDLHAVTFWGCLGVAAVLMLYQGISRDGRIITVFTAEGRALFVRMLRHLWGQ